MSMTNEEQAVLAAAREWMRAERDARLIRANTRWGSGAGDRFQQAKQAELAALDRLREAVAALEGEDEG